MTENLTDFPAGIQFKDEDIYEAMKDIPGYLDITPGDFKEVYLLAYRHALERLKRAVTARQVMTREVVSVRPDTPLAEVAAAMGGKGISGSRSPTPPARWWASSLKRIFWPKWG